MKKLEKDLTLSKPMKTSTGYIVAKLIKKNSAKPLPYLVAKDRVKAEILAQKARFSFANEAKKRMKNIKGKVLGFVTMFDSDKFKELSKDEANQFL